MLDLGRAEYWIFAKQCAEPIILIRNVPRATLRFGVTLKHDVTVTVRGLERLDDMYELQVTQDTAICRIKAQ